MALLRFDPKTYTLSIQVGVLEKYKPDKEIKAIHKKLDRLKVQAEKKLSQLVKGDMTLSERMTELAKNPKAEAKWGAYVNDKFVPEVATLIERIKLKNMKMCEGFKEQVEAQKGTVDE